MNKVRQRGLVVWLVLLGVVVAMLSFASVSGTAAISPVIALAMVVGYLGLLAVMAGRIDLAKLTRQVQPIAAGVRMTNNARRSVSRARSLPEYGVGTGETLVDIGFLVNERRKDGRWDRAIAETASYDDGAIQPYIKVHVPPEHGERRAYLEFEFYDRSGNVQFSHRMEEYLRTGENLVLCERQLPLRGNDALGRAGTWDLRVKIDGSLIAMYDFNMASAGLDNRPAGESQQQAEPRPRARTLPSEDEDVAVSLEDLLREQARRNDSRS